MRFPPGTMGEEVRLAAGGQIDVHTWCWSITLSPDGTTAMTSPGGTRPYHSRGPPPATAA